MVATHTTSLDYQERVVAFVDVLGFSELVKASDADLVARAKIVKLITTDKMFTDFVGKILSSITGEAAFFSDSFVLSMQADRIFYLVREVGYLCRHLLLLGFPCRGAITAGSLYHSERLVVGPAFIKAYQMEQTVAIYPRVVLDDAAMERWREEFRPGSAHPHLEVLVKQDRDAISFIDIFNSHFSEFYPWTDVIPSTDLVPTNPIDFLNAASEQIKRGVTEYRNTPKIYAKYSWLYTQWSEHTTNR